MKTFRVFDTFTNETIYILKAPSTIEASYWVFNNYGDTDEIDVEECEE